MSVKRPVAEVLVKPDLRDSAFGLVWPKMCCCCGDPTGLDTIAIYGKTRYGGANTTFDVPYCRRCTSHHRGPGRRALDSVAAFFAIGFCSLFVVYLFGMLHELAAMFLQSLLLVGSLAWGVRTYSVALAEIRNGITPECSGSEAPAVFFAGKQGDRWRFRFFNRAYAEQFAAANVNAPLTALLTDF